MAGASTDQGLALSAIEEARLALQELWRRTPEERRASDMSEMLTVVLLRHRQAILTTVCHIEWAANLWGAAVLGESFYSAHLDRVSLNSKIAILVALGGRGLPRSDDPRFAAIRVVVKRRNNIVHAKSREVDVLSSEGAKAEPSITQDLDDCSQAVHAFDAIAASEAPASVAKEILAG